MGKKILYVAIIIALIIAGVFVAKQSVNDNETVVKTGANTLENTNKNEEQNVAEENNTVEPEENKIEEDNNVQTGTSQETPEEKAKQIVQENWGEDDSVYYSYDGINSEGKYIICVRDKATTKALYWYYVDVETGTFDIE